MVLVGFLLAAFVVLGVSKYTIDQVDHLASELTEAAKPNPTLNELKELLDTIIIAENKILLYGFQEHRSPDDTTLLFEALGAIQSKRDELSDYAEAESWDQVYVDSVIYLVEEKFVVLDSLIERLNFADSLNAYNDLLSEVESIRKKIERENRRLAQRKPEPAVKKVNPPEPLAKAVTVPPNKAESEQEVEKKQRKGPLAWIFGGKNNDKKKNREARKAKKNNTLNEDEQNKVQTEEVESSPQNNTSSSSSTTITSSPTTITSSNQSNSSPSTPTRIPDKRSARVVRTIETSANEILDKTVKELTGNDAIIVGLINKNRKINDKIHGTIREMELEEAKEIKEKAASASILRTDTNRLLLTVFLTGGILLIILLILIFSRLSKIQQLENSLREEKAQTEKLAKAKEEFLANMSHDIRTPMNAIIGFTRQLSETNLSIRQSEFVKTIKESGRYLLGLINDILDYSKLESGNFSLDNITFSPRKIFEDVQQIYEGQAQQKNIQLETWINGDMPEALQGDPLRLKQMLFNLVNNAIKFTEKGTVSINVHSEVQEEQKVQLYIEVADTGIGIAQDKLDHIFGAYQQAELGTTSQYGGTGLGLAITQKLVESHQGKMDVESMLGQGTIFKLWLPFRIGKVENLQATAQMELDPAPLRGKRVLLADDEPFNLALLETILEKWEVNTKSVENGKHLIKQLGLGGFDYALIDLQMPEMDGFQSAKYIREELKSDIPLIALTATSTPEEMEAALEAGVDHVMLKPFDEGVLLEKMIQLGNEA